MIRFALWIYSDILKPKIQIDTLKVKSNLQYKTR